MSTQSKITGADFDAMIDRGSFTDIQNRISNLYFQTRAPILICNVKSVVISLPSLQTPLHDASIARCHHDRQTREPAHCPAAC